MYREADEALYEARAEGKSRIGLFAPSTTGAFGSDRNSDIAPLATPFVVAKDDWSR